MGSTKYAFGKWNLSLKANQMPTNNFLNIDSAGRGYQTTVAGVYSADLTLEALTADAGNMPFAVGSTVIFNLGTDSLNYYPIPIAIESIEPSADFDGLQPVKISGKSNGVVSNTFPVTLL